MAYEEAKRSSGKIHALTLDDRKRLSVSGVEEVISFDDKEILMQTTDGMLCIKGQELQVDKLSVDTGDVIIKGNISDLSYTEVAPSGSLWTKLFR